MDRLRGRKQRLMALWRSLVGKQLALRRLRPLNPEGLREVPVFCISLASDADKRRYMKAQVRRLGFRSFRFFDAIDGRNLDPGYFAERGLYDDRLARKYENTFVSAPNIALCQTHFALWRLLADEIKGASLVLEDDAVFVGASVSALAPAVLPADWDVVLLDAYVRHKPPRGLISPNVYSMESYRGGTAGYLLSAKGARKLLRLASVPVCHPIDGYMGWYEHHRLEGVDPWRRLDMPPLSAYVVYPRPIENGSLAGFWPSAIGKSLPDY
jgi:GR25 family glycosyltransferase involved in LPS biosynthesis